MVKSCFKMLNHSLNGAPPKLSDLSTVEQLCQNSTFPLWNRATLRFIDSSGYTAIYNFKIRFHQLITAVTDSKKVKEMQDEMQRGFLLF